MLNLATDVLERRRTRNAGAAYDRKSRESAGMFALGFNENAGNAPGEKRRAEPLRVFISCPPVPPAQTIGSHSE
jgi:hypothetical protein